MRAYSPGGTLNAFATVPGLPPTPSVHRLLCGLPGYLNLFAPRTFAPQRQYMARYLPSPSVFFQISTDFTPTPGIPISPPVLKLSSFQRQTGLSPEFLHQTCQAACVPFTPNNSEQRSPPTCYRGCWHVVSRGLFWNSRHRQAIPCPPYSSFQKELYNLTAFIVHAASLHQTFVHCGRFLAAASRRSLGRVSVPMWPSTLSGRLPIVALVGLYPANQLMGRGLISQRSRRTFPAPAMWQAHRIRYYHMFPCAIPD